MDEDIYKKERNIYNAIMHTKRDRYHYYDTPDGHDLLKKLWATTKIGIQAGVIYGGMFAVHKYPLPERRLLVLADAIRIGFPCVVFPMVYTTTTYFLTNIREKDEVLNATIGGAVAGLVFGAWHKSTGLAFTACLLSAFFCGLKKRTVEMGIPFPPYDIPRMTYSSWSLRNLDFTLTKELPGNPMPPRRRPQRPPPPPPAPEPPPPPPSVCDGFETI